VKQYSHTLRLHGVVIKLRILF